MTRSIVPILASLAPSTAVPSTLSLPIREPVSLASVTIVAPPWLKNVATSGAKNGSCKQGLTESASARNLRRLRKFIPSEKQSGTSNEKASFEANAGSARSDRHGGRRPLATLHAYRRHSAPGHHLSA